MSPNGAHVADFANLVRQRWPGHLTLVYPGSAALAVRSADIVCTATTCATPLFPPEGVGPHAHINCMGPHTPDSSEIPQVLLARSVVVIEDRQTAVNEAGKIHAGALEFAQLYSLPSADVKARLSVFSSTGHGYLDLLTVAFVLRDRRGGGPGASVREATA